jgi:hypothetical protein
MNKKIILIMITFTILFVGLAGCNENTNDRDNRFVGTWNLTQPYTFYNITFFSNGTGSWGGSEINWEIKEGKLTVEFPAKPYAPSSLFEYDFTFSDNNQKLTLTGETETINLEKQ